MRIVALLVSLFMFAACNASEPNPELVATTPTQGAGAEDRAEVGEESPPGGMEWGREYADTGEVIAEMEAGGIECRTVGDAMGTVVAARSQSCYLDEAEMERYVVNVYGSAQQQGEAGAHYMGDSTWHGRYVVWGSGWSVVAPFGSDGSEVVAVLGGEAEEISPAP